VGFASIKVILGNMAMPAMMDRLLARKAYEGQLASEPNRPDQIDNLFSPVAVGHVTRGRFDAKARSAAIVLSAATVRAVVALGVAVAIILTVMAAILAYKA
jgi:hypothetical protein